MVSAEKLDIYGEYADDVVVSVEDVYKIYKTADLEVVALSGVSLQILEGKITSSSVIEKAVSMSGILFEMAGMANGKQKAREILENGQALAKMRQILEAQD